MKVRSAKPRVDPGQRARDDTDHLEIPHDVANEQVLLASMLVDEGVCDRLLPILPAESFHVREHKLIREAMGIARRQGLTLDPAVLARLGPEVDVRILEKLPRKRPDVAENLDRHVGWHLWDWHRERVSTGPLNAMLVEVQDPRAEPEKVRALARQVAEAFAQEHGAAAHLRDTGAVIAEVMSGLRRRVRGEAVYPFGIAALDRDEDGNRRCRPGAAPCNATILTGSSGAGKTTLAAHLALGIALQRRRVAIGAWEVRAPMTMELLATLRLGWSRSRTLDGMSSARDGERISEEELGVFESKMRGMAPWVRFIENPFDRSSFDKTKATTNQMNLAVLEDHVAASGAEVVILDLFDRCLRHRRPDDEQEAIWNVLEMSVRQRVHLVLVHQQVIKGDNVRADRRPTLEGLKGSSAYVDAGATILAPHIPSRYKDVDRNKLELYVLKARYDEPFGVEFDWNPRTGQITNGTTFSPFEKFGDDGDPAQKRSAADGAFPRPERVDPGQRGKRRGR